MIGGIGYSRCGDCRICRTGHTSRTCRMERGRCGGQPFSKKLPRNLICLHGTGFRTGHFREFLFQPLLQCLRRQRACEIQLVAGFRRRRFNRPGRHPHLPASILKVLFPILPRGHLVKPPELIVKIDRAVEIAHIGDFRNRQFGPPEQIGGHLQIFL